MKKLLTSLLTTILSILPVHAAPSEQQCMATAIYHEARGESIDGKTAVAQVIINRKNHGFAQTICDVVYQSVRIRGKRMCQFSWACANKSVDVSSSAYLSALSLASAMLSNNFHKRVVTSGTLFFHARYSNPSWSRRMIKVATIGGHKFYQPI